jgi:hypothetical protein
MRAGGLMLLRDHLWPPPPPPLPHELPEPERELQLLPEELVVLLAELMNLVQLTPDESMVTTIA